MPAALATDWNEVETLCVTIGVREAARQLGLNEDSVKTRCRREGWLTKRAEQQTRTNEAIALKRERQGLNPIEPKAADVLSNLGSDSKLKLAIAGNRVVTHLSNMDVDELIEPTVSQSAKHWAGNLALAHGWQQAGSTTAPGVVVNVALLCHDPVAVESAGTIQDAEVIPT